MENRSPRIERPRIERKDMAMFAGCFLVVATAMVSVAAAPRHAAVPVATAAAVSQPSMQSARLHTATGHAVRAMVAF